MSLLTNVALVAMLSFTDPLYTGVTDGNRLFDEERYEEALSAYQKAQKTKPEAPSVDFNIGSTLYNLKRYDESLASYKRVLTDETAPLAKKAMLNATAAAIMSGEKAEEKNDLKNARELYEEAVKLATNYRDKAPVGAKDAKHNLELAINHLRNLPPPPPESKNEKKEKEKENNDKEDKKEEGETNQGEGDDKSDKEKSNESSSPEDNDEQNNGSKPEQGADPGDLTKEQSRNILDAIEREEGKLREDIRKQKIDGAIDTAPGGKDW